MAYRQIGAGAKMKRQSVNVDPDAPYPMDLPRLGYAVIVNNVASEQPGSRADVTSLKTAYQTVGFDVKIYTDCNFQEMLKAKKFIMAEETHKDSNCFALTIICHGNDKGHLFDKDKRKAWDVELLVGELSGVENLTGKPKMLVIQSCRGSLTTEGRVVPDRTLATEDRETINMLPDKADTFLAYATVPGYRAHAGDDSGSIYLQTFSRYLQEEYMRRPLQKILQMVRQYMIRKDQGATGMKQCPQETNTLVYDVVFSEFHQPGISQQSVKSQEIDKEREMQKKMNEMERRMKEKERQHRETSEEKEKELRELRKQMEKMHAEKTRRPIELHFISTHNTDLCHCDSMAVMRQTGWVVVSGLKKENGPWSLFVFNADGGKWKQKEVKSPCGHKFIQLFGVEVQGRELLAVSCRDCKDIKLLDLDTQKVTVTYSGAEVHRMCHGETNRLFVQSSDDSVMELNTSSSTFSLVKTIHTGIYGVYGGMCYVPSRDPCLVVSYCGGVRAVSCSNNQEVWGVEGEVDGCEIDPEGLLFLPQHEVLLVGDCFNDRILVLDPSDGSHVQTIKPGLGKIYDVCLYNDQIIVWHEHQDTFKIAYFSVK